MNTLFENNMDMIQPEFDYTDLGWNQTRDQIERWGHREESSEPDWGFHAKSYSAVISGLYGEISITLSRSVHNPNLKSMQISFIPDNGSVYGAKLADAVLYTQPDMKAATEEAFNDIAWYSDVEFPSELLQDMRNFVMKVGYHPDEDTI